MNANSSPTSGRLQRVLGLRDLLLYGIIVIQPTAPLGSFGVVAVTAQGHVATAILLAMVAMVLTAVSYGRMATLYPTAGSAYAYVGRSLHPHFGFLTGWSIALDYLLNPVIGTIWCAKAAMNLLPLPFPVWVVFFAIFFTWLNLRGIKATARMNLFLTAGMSMVLVAFFVVAAAYLIRTAGWAELFSTRPFYDPQTFSWPLVSTGASIAVLTYMGFDSVSTLSEEVDDPRRNVPLATVLLCVITGILGCLQVYVGQLLWPDFQTFPDVDTAYVSAAGHAGGPWMFHLMNFTLLVATMGSSLGAQLGSVRLLYAMGRDGALPPRFFAQLDPQRNTPRNNLYLTGLVVILGGLTISYQTGAELLNFGAFVAFMGVNLAALRQALGGAGSPRSWMRALPPLAGFLVCLYIWLSLRDGAKLAGGAWLAAGLIYYIWLTRGFKKPVTVTTPA